MKKRLQELFDADHSTRDYRAAVFAEFGLSADKHYDLLVVAPGWKPTTLLRGFDAEVGTAASHSYISGYEITAGGARIAWIQTSAGASSLIDEMSLCAFLDFDKLVFLGAVGSLTAEIGLGAVCTPTWCISGNLANGYLTEDLRTYQPFGRVYPNDPAFVAETVRLIQSMGYAIRQEGVFCTDSILCEYAHMDFIKHFGVSLIEMETSSFYLMADLMEKPAIALLVVSDNSAAGDSLVLRTPEQKAVYHAARSQIIPEIVLRMAGASAN